MARFSALIVALLAAFAAAVCFFARADHIGIAMALVALIFAIDFVREVRQARAEARKFQRSAPVIRPGLPSDDRH